MKTDLDVFFNPEEFGALALYRSEERKVEVITEYNEDADSFYTMIIGKFSDFDGVAVGEVIDVGGTIYRVVDAKPDDLSIVYTIYVNEEL